MAQQLALITGASSGIGEAFARQLAKRGYDLCITGRRSKNLNSISEELQIKHNIHVHTISVDLAADNGIKQIEAWIRENPAISLLINNAGFDIRGQFADKPIEKYMEMVNVHITATIRLSSAVLPAMQKSKQGAIINVSSIAAYLPLTGNAVYSGTKSFLNSFTKALSLELKNTGVKVQLLAPGFTYSDFHKRPEFSGHNIYTSIPKYFWTTSEQVAQTSLKALDKNKFECIPGWINKMIVATGKMGLASFGSKIMALINNFRSKQEDL